MSEPKLTKCATCKSTIQQPRHECKRCLINAYERDMSDTTAGHIANLIANRYGVDIHLFESITDRTARKMVDDHLEAWADENEYHIRIKFEGDATLATVWGGDMIVMADTTKLNRRYYLKNGKKQRDNFDRSKGRVIAKLNLYNLWVGGAF